MSKRELNIGMDKEEKILIIGNMAHGIDNDICEISWSLAEIGVERKQKET